MISARSRRACFEYGSAIFVCQREKTRAARATRRSLSNLTMRTACSTSVPYTSADSVMISNGIVAMTSMNSHVLA